MIEEVLERIASALERIEARYAGRMDEKVKAAEAALTPGPEPGKVLALEPEPLTGDALRESLKTQLRAKGIKFKDASRTETLQKLLADWASAQAHAETCAAADAFKETKQEEPKEEVTLEMVRNALISLSAAKGKDTALALLKDKGRTEKLSQVDPTLYATVLSACKEKEKAA